MIIFIVALIFLMIYVAAGNEDCNYYLTISRSVYLPPYLDYDMFSEANKKYGYVVENIREMYPNDEVNKFFKFDIFRSLSSYEKLAKSDWTALYIAYLKKILPNRRSRIEFGTIKTYNGVPGLNVYNVINDTENLKGLLDDIFEKYRTISADKNINHVVFPSSFVYNDVRGQAKYYRQSLDDFMKIPESKDNRARPLMSVLKTLKRDVGGQILGFAIGKHTASEGIKIHFDQTNITQGDVYTINIGPDIFYDMYPIFTDKFTKPIRIRVKNGSMVHMSDEARVNWAHSVPDGIQGMKGRYVIILKLQRQPQISEWLQFVDNPKMGPNAGIEHGIFTRGDPWNNELVKGTKDFIIYSHRRRTSAVQIKICYPLANQIIRPYSELIRENIRYFLIKSPIYSVLPPDSQHFNMMPGIEIFATPFRRNSEFWCGIFDCVKFGALGNYMEALGVIAETGNYKGVFKKNIYLDFCIQEFFNHDEVIEILNKIINKHECFITLYAPPIYAKKIMNIKYEANIEFLYDFRTDISYKNTIYKKMVISTLPNAPLFNATNVKLPVYLRNYDKILYDGVPIKIFGIESIIMHANNIILFYGGYERNKLLLYKKFIEEYGTAIDITGNGGSVGFNSIMNKKGKIVYGYGFTSHDQLMKSAENIRNGKKPVQNFEIIFKFFYGTTPVFPADTYEIIKKERPETVFVATQKNEDNCMAAILCTKTKYVDIKNYSNTEPDINNYFHNFYGRVWGTPREDFDVVVTNSPDHQNGKKILCRGNEKIMDVRVEHKRDFVYLSDYFRADMYWNIFNFYKDRHADILLKGNDIWYNQEGFLGYFGGDARYRSGKYLYEYFNEEIDFGKSLGGPSILDWWETQKQNISEYYDLEAIKRKYGALWPVFNPIWFKDLYRHFEVKSVNTGDVKSAQIAADLCGLPNSDNADMSVIAEVVMYSENNWIDRYYEKMDTAMSKTSKYVVSFAADFRYSKDVFIKMKNWKGGKYVGYIQFYNLVSPSYCIVFEK